MFKFTEGKWWFLFVFMFIMPLNGFVGSHKPSVGLLLILFQIPLCIVIMKKISKYKNEKE